MGYGKYSRRLEFRANRFLYEEIGLHIDGGCRFIQNQYTGFPQEGSSKAQQLSLTNATSDKIKVDTRPAILSLYLRFIWLFKIGAFALKLQ